MNDEISRAMNRLSDVRQWIHDTIARHAEVAQPVQTFCLQRLGQYFEPAFLQGIRAAVVERVPSIPLVTMGLPELADFAEMPAAGITFTDMYFVGQPYTSDEELHVHELVHAVQWAELGVDGFLVAYGVGLLRYGYHNSPLELQARRHESRFSRGETAYDIPAAVRAELPGILASLEVG
jgi:hypothetical protein